MNGNGNSIGAIIDAEGSVKRGDRHPFVDGKNGYITINVMPDILFTQHLPVELPIQTWYRDRLLLSTIRHESFWGAAVSIGVAKFATQGWEVESDMPTLRKRYQQIIVNAEAGGQVGWNTFCRYFITSYYCTKAAIVEIARETHSMGSRITGIHHLDPLRCLLTNDPETPVVYQSRYDDKWHEMKWWQVGVFASMPDVTELSGGAGICAAERAYPQILKLAAVERYMLDKITGRRPLALYLANGISITQIQDAVDSGKADAERKGWTQFMGALIAANPRNASETGLITIPLAELPDGFDRKQELDITLLAYANNLGLDPQDLQPLTGQQLGAGAQSQVLDEKSKGRDLKVVSEEVEKFFNEKVLPEKVQFSFHSKDLRDEKQEADNMNARADWVSKLIDKGVLNAEQGNNILVDYEDIPVDYRAIDTLNTGDLSDDEKPDLAEGQQGIVPPVMANGQPQSPQRRTAFTPSQTQGIVNIVAQAQRGELTTATAIQLLKTAYSLTEEEARSLLEADNPQAKVQQVEPDEPLAQAQKAIASLMVDLTKATRKPTKEQKQRAGNLMEEEMAMAKRLYKEFA